MKVLLYNNQPINIYCVKNTNSHYLSSPIKDTFYKSNVSFRGENPFTPDEQAEINRANKNDASSRARLAELKAKGLNIKDALACLNLNNPFEVDEYIRLTSNNNDLDTLDKIGLIAYEINGTERYKHLCKLGLEKYEALIATKLGLNDDEIKTYFNKKDKGTQLDIQEDELMLCIKNGINNDEQFTRFAQLRNRKRNFQNETVRKKGEEQPYPIEYIIHCIKEGKTDSDIVRENRLIDLMNEGFSIDTLATILSLPTEKYNQFRKNIKEGRDAKEEVELAALTEKQREIYEALVSKGEIKSVAFGLAQLTKEQREKYKTLLNNGEDIFGAVHLTQLTDEQHEIYKKLVSSGEDRYTAQELAKLTEKQRERYKTLISSGETPLFALNLAKIMEEQYDRFKSLVNNGEDKYAALRFVTLTKEQSERYKTRISNGEDKDTALICADLTEKQYKRYKSLVSRGEDVFNALCLTLNKLTDEQREKYREHLIYSSDDKSLALRRAALTNEQRARYKKLVNGGENDVFAMAIAELTDEQYERYKKIPIQISELQAITLAKTTNLTSVTPELIEKLPEDFWYMTSMGCEKEASEIMHKAIESMLLRDENNDFVLSPLRNIEIRTPLVNYSSNYSYNQNNGDFQLSSTQPFSVNLSHGYINQKPLLVIKDKNSSNQYISYNGAIAQVKGIIEHDSEQFRNWGNLSPKKQSKILSKAADEFIFNIFDEEGNCIIGQKSPKFNTKEKTDDEIEQYYAQKLLELKNRNELTPQNILKLMPKNCMLTISPYIQGGNILYAIVTEWFSKNGNRWQMEIHSQDLKYSNDEKWIFRLHKTTSASDKHYFKFAENENGYDFNGEFNGGDAHIKINTPLEDNNLLNNVAFQAIITLISAKLCKDFAINKVAEKIGVTVEENNSFATMGNIVKHCLKNVKDFANNKDQIIKMRAALGKIRLV